MSLLRNYLLRSGEQLDYIRNVDSSEDWIFNLHSWYGKMPAHDFMLSRNRVTMQPTEVKHREHTVGICDLCGSSRELSLSTPGLS